MCVNNRILLIVYLFLSQGVNAQFTESITTSRPGASYTSYTTGKNILQFQTGVAYDTDNDKSIDYARNGISYSLQVRYGITETFEIRSSLILRNDKITTSGSDSSFGGLALFDIGFLWNVIDGRETGTSLGFQTEFRINRVGDANYQIEELAPRTIAIFITPINNWLTFSTNLGISWYDIAGKPNGLYTLNLGFPLFSKINGFIEMFGTFTSESFGKNFDTGIGFPVNNNLYLDLSFGFVERVQTNFVDAGLSWRISTK